MRAARRIAALCAAVPLACALGAGQARAACERAFNVPLALTGSSAAAATETLAGAYPELLRSFETKSSCRFTLSVVPRARQEALFMGGHSDLLLPATRTPTRDRYGYFIAMLGNRATAISFNPRQPALHSVAELLADKTLRVALVRGVDYGDAYRAMVTQLQAQGRLMLEANPVEVARVLQAGMADLTLMSPSSMLGALHTDARVAAMAPAMRIEPLDEIAWGETGVYISRLTVSAEDRAALEKLLAGAVKSGAVWEAYKRHYPAEVLAGGVRQR